MKSKRAVDVLNNSSEKVWYQDMPLGILPISVLLQGHLYYSR